MRGVGFARDCCRCCDTYSNHSNSSKLTRIAIKRHCTHRKTPRFKHQADQVSRAAYATNRQPDTTGQLLARLQTKFVAHAPGLGQNSCDIGVIFIDEKPAEIAALQQSDLPPLLLLYSRRNKNRLKHNKCQRAHTTTTTANASATTIEPAASSRKTQPDGSAFACACARAHVARRTPITRRTRASREAAKRVKPTTTTRFACVHSIVSDMSTKRASVANLHTSQARGDMSNKRTCRVTTTTSKMITHRGRTRPAQLLMLACGWLLASSQQGDATPQQQHRSDNMISSVGPTLGSTAQTTATMLLRSLHSSSSQQLSSNQASADQMLWRRTDARLHMLPQSAASAPKQTAEGELQRNNAAKLQDYQGEFRVAAAAALTGVCVQRTHLAAC